MGPGILGSITFLLLLFLLLTECRTNSDSAKKASDPIFFVPKKFLHHPSFIKKEIFEIP